MRNFFAGQNALHDASHPDNCEPPPHGPLRRLHCPSFVRRVCCRAAYRRGVQILVVLLDRVYFDMPERIEERRSLGVLRLAKLRPSQWLDLMVVLQ